MSERLYTDELFVDLYDPLNPWGRSDEFYFDLAIHRGGSVLDLGCGTGMLACRLAERGLAVTGVDVAASMLAVARLKAFADRVCWHQADVRKLQLGGRFDTIIMTGHAFQALLRDDDVDRMLIGVARHLAADGVFAFETRNPAARAWTRWVPEHSERNVGDARVFDNCVYDEASGILELQTSVALPDRETVTATSKLRFMREVEVDRALAHAGLHARARFGDWGRGELIPVSREMIFLVGLTSTAE